MQDIVYAMLNAKTAHLLAQRGDVLRTTLHLHLCLVKMKIPKFGLKIWIFIHKGP
jgi:hypothetical protein